MRKVGLLLLLTVLLAVPAMGQNEYPKAEVFGGFSYARSQQENWPGWTASGAVNFHKNAGIVGEFAANYKSFPASYFVTGAPGEVKLRSYHYLFGPRFSFRSERATVFAHALFGGTRFGLSYEGFGIGPNFLSMAYGGGVDVNVGKHAAIRVAQVDLVMDRWTSFSVGGVQIPAAGWQRSFVYSAGVVFKVGGK